MHGFSNFGQTSPNQEEQDFIFFINYALAIAFRFVYNNTKATKREQQRERQKAAADAARVRQ